MSETRKPNGREHFVDEGKPSEEVVNDSLGTVDPADSTGTDCDKEIEADKAGRTMEKLHPDKG